MTITMFFQDDLMSGMQDVAALADRYTNLSITSQKLHRNVGRLKKEVIQNVLILPFVCVLIFHNPIL